MPFYTVQDPIITQGRGRRITRDMAGRLWVVYDQTIVGPAWFIYASYSDDDGVSWTEEVITIPGEMSTRGNPSIAADSLGNIHVVYTDDVGNAIYRRRISTGWEAPETINPAGNSEDQAIAIDSLNNIHVSYTLGFSPWTTGIGYRQKTAAGVWLATEDVVLAADQMASDIVVDLNDDVHVVWYGIGWGANPADNQILYRKRTAGVWGAQELVTDIAAGGIGQIDPSLIVSMDGHVHVAWSGWGWGANPGIINIRYRERDAASWLAHTALTDVANGLQLPTICLDSSGDLYVTWYGSGWGANPANLNIPYRKRQSGGWQATQLITDRAFDQFFPSLMGALYPRWGDIYLTIPAVGFVLAFQGNAAGPTRYEVFLDPSMAWLPTPPSTSIPKVLTLAATGVT